MKWMLLSVFFCTNVLMATPEEELARVAPGYQYPPETLLKYITGGIRLEVLEEIVLLPKQYFPISNDILFFYQMLR